MYQIKLDKFQGPFDLLLDLIEKNKMSINDISLSSITDNYLKYLESIQFSINIDEIVSFLDIASKLILIKSKALIPFLEFSKEEEQEVNELKNKLELYKIFRDLARGLRKMYAKTTPFYSRNVNLMNQVVFYPPENINKEKLRIFFEHIVNEFEELKKKIIYPGKVLTRLISLKDKIKEIEKMIQEKIQISFKEIKQGCKSKFEVIVGFLAILELMKSKIIVIEQNKMFDEIQIKKIQ